MKLLIVLLFVGVNSINVDDLFRANNMGTYFFIQHQSSGKFLDSNNNGDLNLNAQNYSLSQVWYVKNGLITNAQTDRRLESSDDNLAFTNKDIKENPYQKWLVEETTYIKNNKSLQYLDVNTDGKVCTSSTKQSWKLIPAPVYYLKSNSEPTVNSLPLDSFAQDFRRTSWYFIKQEEKYFKIQNLENKKFLYWIYSSKDVLYPALISYRDDTNDDSSLKWYIENDKIVNMVSVQKKNWAISSVYLNSEEKAGLDEAGAVWKFLKEY